jgi:hypothetical protein
MLAQKRRIEGLLWLAEGRREDARAALMEAERVFAYRYGEAHWRTQQVRRELAPLAPGS